jgi:hypothetical protein
LRCRIKNCRQCTAPPCGVCSNCLHPEYKNKCAERYSFCCVGTNLNWSIIYFMKGKKPVFSGSKKLKCHICGIGFSKKNLITVRINCVFFVYYLFSLGNCFFIGTRICNAVLRILVVYPGSKLSPSRVLDLNFLPIRDP